MVGLGDKKNFIDPRWQKSSEVSPASENCSREISQIENSSHSNSVDTVSEHSSDFALCITNITIKHSVTCFWNIYSDLVQSSFSTRILTNQVTRGCFWFDDLKEGVRPGSILNYLISIFVSVVRDAFIFRSATQSAK